MKLVKSQGRTLFDGSDKASPIHFNSQIDQVQTPASSISLFRPQKNPSKGSYGSKKSDSLSEVNDILNQLTKVKSSQPQKKNMRLVSKDMNSQIDFEKLLCSSPSKQREESILNNSKVESVTPNGRLKSPINFTESAEQLMGFQKEA